MTSPNAEPATQDEPLPEDNAPAAGEVVAEATEALLEGGAGEGDLPAEASNDEGDELVITLGDEPAPEADSFRDDDGAVLEGLTPVQVAAFVRLRQQRAAAKRELLRVQSAAVQPAAVQPEIADPGPMPTIESVDFDNEKHAEAVSAWVERKTAHDNAKTKARQDQEEQHNAWLKRVQRYEVEKKALRVPNYAEAEDNILQHLSLMQQGLLIKAPERRAELMYAIGNSPKRLQALAAIKDPVDFLYEVGKILHKDLKVQQRSKPPVPERVPGGGSGSGAGTAIASTRRLAELKEKARVTGDYSAYYAEKRRVEDKRAA